MRYEQECIPADHPIPNTRFTVKNIFLEPDFSRTCGFRRMLAYTLFYQFQQLKVPIPWLDFLQNVKNLIFWHIFVIFGWFRIFDQKRALSVSSYYRYLTSCKKSEWSHDQFSRKSGNGLTDGRTNMGDLIGPNPTKVGGPKLSYDKQTLIHEVDEAAMPFLALRYDWTVLSLLVCVHRSSLIWCVFFLFSCLLNVISLSWKILAHFQQFLSRPWSALARCYQIG